MKCPNCNGIGKEYSFYDGEKSVWKDSVCPTCNGTGVVEPLTGQEYLQTCTTEQLAEAIFRICERATWDYNVKIMVGEKKKELIVAWLKQPHQEETKWDLQTNQIHCRQCV